jgi:hypothetical protein
LRVTSRGLGDVYKRQTERSSIPQVTNMATNAPNITFVQKPETLSLIVCSMVK